MWLDFYVLPAKYRQMALLLMQSNLTQCVCMSFLLGGVFVYPGHIYPAELAGDAHACQRRGGQGLPLAGQLLCQPAFINHELFSLSFYPHPLTLNSQLPFPLLLSPGGFRVLLEALLGLSTHN